MNIIDIKKNCDLNHVETEVCVIGSGPGGGIVAAELAQKNIDVVLLESGGELPNNDIDSIANIDIGSNLSQLRMGHSQELGGSSKLWDGRTCLFDEIDFEQRSWIPNSGWPFDRKELEPYYRKAVDILKIPKSENFFSSAYQDKKQSGLNTVFEGKGLEAKCFQWAQKPFDVSVYLTDVVKNYPSLRIILNARASRLKESENASRVESAQVTKLDGSIVVINARQFVLAAGGIETPRLLLNSSEIRPTGIGNDHDVVGRYFSTHPKANMAAVILDKPISVQNTFFANRALGEGRISYGLGLTRETQRNLKLLNHYFQFFPLPGYSLNKAFGSVKKINLLDEKLIDGNKLLKGFWPGLLDISHEIARRTIKSELRIGKFLIRGFLDQYPDKNNRIALSGEKKADGTFRTDVRWRYSDRDKESVLDFLKHLDKTLKGLGMGRVEYSRLNGDEDWDLVAIHSHFMGTTRMGKYEKTSVTDQNARVHGSSNLYIAGPSLFPTYGFANPFLTIVALSLRLAEHLSEKNETVCK